MNKTIFFGVAAAFALLLGLAFSKSNFFRPALAQHLNAAAKATYVTAADMSATVNHAPEMDQPIRVVDAGQYNVGVYITRRLQEADQGCTIEHDTVALDDVTEIMRVIEGSGTLVTGGTLRDEKRTNPENLTGSGIDGGTPRRITKGDWVMVPEKTPHWFSQVEGTIVLMSIHLPHAAGTGSSR